MQAQTQMPPFRCKNDFVWTQLFFFYCLGHSNCALAANNVVSAITGLLSTKLRNFSPLLEYIFIHIHHSGFSQSSDFFIWVCGQGMYRTAQFLCLGGLWRFSPWSLGHCTEGLRWCCGHGESWHQFSSCNSFQTIMRLVPDDRQSDVCTCKPILTSESVTFSEHHFMLHTVHWILTVTTEMNELNVCL